MDDRQPLLHNIQQPTYGDVGLGRGKGVAQGENARSRNTLPTSTEDDAGNNEASCGFYFPRRYILVIMLFLGTANCFAVRVNLNVALLAMVNSTDTSSVNDTADHCPGKGNIDNSTSGSATGEFNWSPDLQSVLLGGFYYGYPLVQPFAGVLAEKFGARRLLIIASACAGVLNLLMPVVAKWNVYGLVAMRVLLGLVLGPVWPAMAAMVPRWTLEKERTQLYAACNSGLYIGTVVSQSISGVLCAPGATFLGGWPAAFYVFGIASLVYSGCFWFLTADTPAEHKSISKQEREMIQANTGDTSYHRPPYGKIIRSRAVWCFFIMLLMDITSYDILFTYLPLYMKRVLKFDITASGGLASVPYVISIIVTFFSGYSADVIRNRGWLSTMWIRRIYTILGDMGPAVCVFIITFLNCDRTMVVFFFILCISISGFNNGGFNVNMFDIAPRYAGTIFGVINGVSNIGGFVGPLIVGALTQNSGSVSLWHLVFYIVIALYTIGVVVFCVFGSADLQSWANPEPQDSDVQKNEEPPKQDSASLEPDTNLPC